MNIHAARPLTDAIIYSLQSAGLIVGDAVKPANATTSSGYIVVYGLPGGTLDGPIGLPDDDAWVTYQLTAIGANRKQCEWAADKARRTILAAYLPIGDRRVVRVSVDMLGGTIRDDDIQEPVYYSPDRYRFSTTPA